MFDGYIADPTSVSEWIDRMLRLLQDPQLAVQMGVKGHMKLLASCSIEHVAEEMEMVYETALTETR